VSVADVYFVMDLVRKLLDIPSYINLGGREIVLNMQATTEDKSDDTKGSFYKELQHVFDQF
jgi:hypothetical protein